MDHAESELRDHPIVCDIDMSSGPSGVLESLRCSSFGNKVTRMPC